jgi:hypothetical protein
LLSPALNGSGKSLFSATITQLKTEVFDGDKHLAHLKKHFPEIGSDVLLDRVNDGLFPQAKEKAISAKENFAFETNFVAEAPTRHEVRLRSPALHTSVRV